MKSKKSSSALKSNISREAKLIPVARSIEAFPLTYEVKELFDEYEEFQSKAGGFDPMTAEVTRWSAPTSSRLPMCSAA